MASWVWKHTAIAQRGLQYLIGSQNSDGGWGGGLSVPYASVEAATPAIRSSIEETALALEALMQCSGVPPGSPTIMRGLEWLCATIEKDNLNCSWPIGFYFAKLWYHERLYRRFLVSLR